ncbi:MAG: tetratricopeptide repeat protein [Desulfobulbaceae bacterium]|nr:tetratricopeptide repeat protein [Desulfobulbaceae bacterium]
MTDRTKELLQQAIALHRRGQLAQAEGLYAEILKIQPKHFDALHLLGVIAFQAQNHQRAVDLINQAIEIYPHNSAFYSSRGAALQELKQYDAAIASYDQAITLKPDYADAWYNRGLALQARNQLEAAIASYDKVLALRPDFPEAWSNRGAAFQGLNQLEAAVGSYDQAIKLKPDYAEAWSNRGVALHRLDKLDAAIASFDKAIAHRPFFAEAYNNRGLALDELKLHDSAIASYDQAIRIKPDYAEAWYNRGNSQEEINKSEAALESYDQAIRIKPDYPEALCNQGLALQQLNMLDTAIASYDRAIAINPDFSAAYMNKSIALLLRGDYENAWELYESRWKINDVHFPTRSFIQPIWLGNFSIQGKTILLYSEQSFGDTIQFCRYVKLVAELGTKVILEVEQPLIGLLRQLEGVAEFVPKGALLPSFDYHCPLMSLALAFNTTLDSIPSFPKYLSSDKDKVTEWEGRLGPKTRPRIGLVWSSMTTHYNVRNRNVQLSSLVKELPSEFQFVSLQKEVMEDDLATLRSHTDILHHGEELKDFAETAALCELMDLVISVDTSVAHLSAALGKPTWVMLPFSPSWRWLLGRVDSPWYPGVKLYRQTLIGDWSNVFERVRTDLLKIGS